MPQQPDVEHPAPPEKEPSAYIDDRHVPAQAEPATVEEHRADEQANAAAMRAVAEGVPFGGTAVLSAERMPADAENEAQAELDEGDEDGAAEGGAAEAAEAATIAQPSVPQRAAEAGSASTSVESIVVDVVPASAPEPDPTQDEPLAPEPLHLERKHLIGIRWMHWINFPVLFTMIWSGLLIYWNDSDNAYQHPHRVYRIGLGPITLFRFFPDWFYTLIHAQYNVTKGLGYHFFFMWIFGLNGMAYVSYLLVTREWKFMVPDRKSLVEALQVTLIDMHLLKRPLPFQTKYNGAQKIAYTSVILMGLGSLVTGLAIYKPTSAHWLTEALGGYEMARWLHFMLTMGFCAFFFIHVYQVAAAGWNNFRAMVTGMELRRVGEPSLEAERRRF